MQELTLTWNYQDFLQRSATVYDYWLYSQTHHLPSAGRRYKMVTWLVADEEVLGEVQMTIERLLTAPLEVVRWKSKSKYLGCAVVRQY